MRVTEYDGIIRTRGFLLGVWVRAHMHTYMYTCAHPGMYTQAFTHRHAQRPYLHPLVLQTSLAASVIDHLSPCDAAGSHHLQFNMQFLPCQAGLPADGVVDELAAQNVIRGPGDRARTTQVGRTAWLP